MRLLAHTHTPHDPTVRHEHMRRVHKADGYGRHDRGMGRECKVVSFVSQSFRDRFATVSSSFGQGCQRLLTVGKWAGGDTLEVLERRVDLESLGEVLCALWTE